MGLMSDIEKPWSNFMPGDGSFSELAWDRSYDLVRRCKVILNNRTPAEIDQIALDANNIVNEHRETIDEIVNDIWDKAENPITRFSIPRLLWICTDIVDLQHRITVKNPTWSEYLATASLQQFKRFRDSIEKNSSFDTPDIITREGWPLVVAENFADAIEAVTLAEFLATDQDSLSLIKTELKSKLERAQSDQRRSAAKKRHDPTSALLRDLAQFYDQGNFKSYRDAVIQFLDQIPEDRYRHLAPTNRLRTLAEGLSAIKRGKRMIEYE